MTTYLPALTAGSTILFQGDSITDGGRWHTDDPNHYFGQCYVFLIAAQCGARRPDAAWTFVNRGVSANKITDLVDRWQPDTLEIKPDVLSILIGINDTLSYVDKNIGPDSTDFEQLYDNLLHTTVSANPAIKLVLCEPFVLPVGWLTENFNAISTELKRRQHAVQRLASKYDAHFVQLQQPFNDACNLAPITHWLWDGVHPTAAGNQLIAEEWLSTVSSK